MKLGILPDQQSAPRSPKYLAATPSRPGQPDIKVRKDDKHRSTSPDRELYSFFVVRPSYDSDAAEETDDKSIQFMFVGRPDIEEGGTQGRHIHAYALYKEAIYSILEQKDVLEIPHALHQFLERHKHYYNTDDAKKRSYDERVFGFVYQTVDDDSTSSHAYRTGFYEATTRQQRVKAEQLDNEMFSYFRERCNEISRARGVHDFDMETLSQLEDLSPDEQKVVSLYTSFCERQSYLTARNIRANMKDAEYIKICSKMNEMVSEAIEIINGMPGIAFKFGSSKGSGEKDGLRRLREENAKPVAEQDPKLIALNMRRLIDFPPEFFGKEIGQSLLTEGNEYDLTNVLKNHVELVRTAFPSITLSRKVLVEFFNEVVFTKNEDHLVIDSATGEVLDFAEGVSVWAERILACGLEVEQVYQAFESEVMASEIDVIGHKLSDIGLDPTSKQLVEKPKTAAMAAEAKKVNAQAGKYK